MQRRNSRLKTAVRRAVAEHGGRLSTRDAAEIAYPRVFEARQQLNKSAYMYLRRALREIARPIGRSPWGPGHPILWEAKPDFRYE